VAFVNPCAGVFWNGLEKLRLAQQRNTGPLKVAWCEDAERPCRIVEPKPFRALIVPGGVYGGDGAIFAPENPIFQSKNRFFAVSAPGNP